MGGIEARSGEMMEALMGMWRTTKPPQPQYHSAQNASANMLSDDYCCKIQNIMTKSQSLYPSYAWQCSLTLKQTWFLSD